MVTALLHRIWHLFYLWVMINLGFYFLLHLVGYTDFAQFAADNSYRAQGNGLLSLIDIGFRFVINDTLVHWATQPVLWVIHPLLPLLPPDIRLVFPETVADGPLTALAQFIATLPGLKQLPFIQQLGRINFSAVTPGGIYWVYPLSAWLWIKLDHWINRGLDALAHQLQLTQMNHQGRLLMNAHHKLMERQLEASLNRPNKKAQKPIPIENRGELRALLDDFKEEMRTLQQENTYAKQDGLTGLYSRNTFNKQYTVAFNAAMTGAVDLALMVLDVDNFKSLNDTYGHDVGDTVLSQVGQTLNMVLQPYQQEAKAYRYGGEELVVIFSNHSPEEAFQLAETIRHKMHHITLPQQPNLRISVSIGLVFARFSHRFRELKLTEDELFKQADSLLYEAKTSGKNKVCSAIL